MNIDFWLATFDDWFWIFNFSFWFSHMNFCGDMLSLQTTSRILVVDSLKFYKLLWFISWMLARIVVFLCNNLISYLDASNIVLDVQQGPNLFIFAQRVTTFSKIWNKLLATAHTLVPTISCLSPYPYDIHQFPSPKNQAYQPTLYPTYIKTNLTTNLLDEIEPLYHPIYMRCHYSLCPWIPSVQQTSRGEIVHRSKIVLLLTK